MDVTKNRSCFVLTPPNLGAACRACVDGLVVIALQAAPLVHGD